ncbi:protein far1-related sequence 5-like [Gigaspora margarita]|uniref:Protein far1-related sequence 5-like n=1 Tax=Gigaspora margarita TaxID=4874 RepID=A0A8H4ATM6_GIGMA|nr:protein far1-related sequence 5-like [Gigaspora margarita]
MNSEHFLENTDLDNNNETSSDIDISDDENSLDVLNDNYELPNDNITSQGQITSNNPITIMVGKTFTDWNGVQEYINAYAISKGFATILRRTERNMNIIIRADIVCRRAGAASNASTGLRMTKSIATNCPFKVVVRWTKKNKYSVRSVNLEHNHLLDSAAIKFDPGHRRLSRNENAHIQMLYDSGVPVPTIVNMLTEQYNRYIHNKDVYNSLSHKSRDYVTGLSQTAELLNNLNNNDEMPLLLVSGFDAMGISFLIASCLLANETAPNFCWALRQLKKIAEANTYMTEQWKPYESMWAYSYTNKYVNYGVKTTQQSEDTNLHLKRLLNHAAPLPELVSALNKLTNHQLQRSQYQQYRLRNSIRQQCPKSLKDVSLLHTIYQTDDEYTCSCDYNVQFSLPCRHVLAVYIVNKKALSTDCIGARWIISSAVLNITEEEKENYVADNITADNITVNNITVIISPLIRLLITMSS